MVTLLFTDLVGSTQLIDRLGDDEAEELRQLHFGLLRQAVSEAGGREVKSLGDGLMVSFASPADALRCAVRMQRAVADHNREGDRTREGTTLRVRIGVHAGEPVQAEDDFFGSAVVVAKRLCDEAQGGEILVSDLVRGLVGSRGRFLFRPAGPLHLKGLAEPVATVRLEWEAPGSPDRSKAPARSRARAPRSRGPRLVGRGNELSVLRTELARAEGGEFRCVLITGEPGVGKTRLASEFQERHRLKALGLSARAYPLSDTAPFGLWCDALEPFLQGLTSGEVVRLCGGFLDDLAGLLHSVAAVRGSSPAREPPKALVLEGLAWMLETLAGGQPLIAVLDDAYLADASSWEVLRYVARHLADVSLLLIVTARPAELARHEIAPQVVFELDQEGLLTRIDVGPLEREGMAELAEALLAVSPPEALVDWVAERSLGNALFAIGLIRALLEEGGDPAHPRLERLPESLTERVISRTRHLDAAQRSTLELLAVLGRPCALGVLADLAGRPLEEVADVVTELVAARVVVERERGRDLTYEIPHPLVRDAVYQSIGGARRWVLHRKVAAALRAGGRVAEAARHFARSSDVGDPEAIDSLRDAIRQAEQQEAYREALELLGELVELLPPHDERWFEVFDALSWRAEWVVDHLADTHAVLGVKAMRALDVLLDRQPDTARRAAVKLRLASFLAWGTGDLEEAEHAACDAQRLFVEAGDRRQSLLAARELAWVHGLQGRFATMEQEAAEVAEAALSIGERSVALRGLATAGSAALFRGRFQESETAIRRALVLTREDAVAFRFRQLLATLGTCLVKQGRVREGLGYLEQAKAGNPNYRETLVVELEVQARWTAGDYRRAVEAGREALAWSPAGTSRRRAHGMIWAALAAAETGETGAAREFLARASGALGDRDWLVYSQFCRHGEAVLSWAEGHHAEAAASLAPAAARLVEMGAFPWAAIALVDVGQMAAEAGQVQLAAEVARTLDGIAAQIDRPLHFGLAALSQAWARLAGGDATGAAVAARTAVARLSDTGWSGHLARAEDVLGRALAGTDRAGAVKALGRAAAGFEAAGACWRRDRVLDALRALGSPGRRAAGAALGQGALTRREREVARLAAAGRSAREIAEALFVSERTVETHLTGVYAKLGVTSKVDLVRRASEFGL